jgi:hypothetical protein
MEAGIHLAALRISPHRLVNVPGQAGISVAPIWKFECHFPVDHAWNLGRFATSLATMDAVTSWLKKTGRCGPYRLSSVPDQGR